MNRDQIITGLRSFAAQRPGLDFRMYCSGFNDKDGRAAYFAEVRQITRTLHDARELLRAVELSSMPMECLVESFRAYSGRLTLTDEGDRIKLDYCAGQYYPTEYRNAVCAVAAAALWAYHREDFAAAAREGESQGDAIRRQFRQLFGRGMAKRWFS